MIFDLKTEPGGLDFTMKSISLVVNHGKCNPNHAEGLIRQSKITLAKLFRIDKKNYKIFH